MTKTDSPLVVPAPVARAKWLGGISDVTLWRWRRNLPDFPKPIRVNRRTFYKVAELEAFMAARQGVPEPERA